MGPAHSPTTHLVFVVAREHVGPPHAHLPPGRVRHRVVVHLRHRLQPELVHWLGRAHRAKVVLQIENEIEGDEGGGKRGGPSTEVPRLGGNNLALSNLGFHTNFCISMTK